jgi:hypothetical protein
VILRCELPRKRNRFEKCDGLIGGVPDDALVVGLLARVGDERPGCFAMRCPDCKRIVEVCQPMDRAA